jgi:hypothetical protein
VSSSPRDPTLPDDFKDLLDLVESEQRTSEALERAEQDISLQGQKLAPVIFARLLRTIDHDLLFCEDSALVMPDIRTAVADVLNALTPGMGSGKLDAWMVDIVSREVRNYILKRRPES